MKEGKKISAYALAKLCALGAFAGLVNGIFGSGGGVAIVLCLWGFAKEQLGERRRVFANVTAMILPISLASSLVYFNLSPPELSSGLGIALAALVGGGVGAFLLGRLDLRILKLAFAVLLLISGGIMIFG